MPRSIRVRPDLIPRVKLALQHNGFLRQQDLVEAVGLANSTVRKFLNGKPVDYATFVEICQRLNLEWGDFADLGEITELHRESEEAIIAQYSTSVTEKITPDTLDLAEREEAIAKPQHPDSAEDLPAQPLEEGEAVSNAPNSIRSEERKDLLSLAISLLDQVGFDKKFEENRTSQYIGYRLKHPGETDKRHQLVLFEKEACVGIAIPQIILSQYLLEFKFNKEVLINNKYFGSHEHSYFDLQEFSRKYWVRPSKEDVFFEISKKYNKILGGQSRGTFHLDPEGINPLDRFINYEIYGKVPEFKVRRCKDIITKYYFDHSDYLKRLDNSDCCLQIVDTDNFFPYAWQVSINSSEVLEESIGYFAKVLMEA